MIFSFSFDCLSATSSPLIEIAEEAEMPFGLPSLPVPLYHVFFAHSNSGRENGGRG